ncbi:hypothetical protein QTP88_006247 [Uroleucon formosanum]
MKNWLISFTLSVNNELEGNENENKNNITEAEQNDQSLLHFNKYPLISPEIPEVQYENTLSDININKTNISQSTSDLTDPVKWPIITDVVRLHIIKNGPKLIENIDQYTFPLADDGRRFNFKWFYKKLPNCEDVKRQWMMYSCSKNFIFCFPCIIFLKDKNLTFSNPLDGFYDWKHLNPFIPAPENSVQYRKFFMEWKETEKRLKDGKTIDNFIRKAVNIKKEKWLNILKIIIAVIHFCAKNDLALRGISDKIGDANSGIFLNTVELINHYNDRLSGHIENIKSEKGSLSYFSPIIQNEIIGLIESFVDFIESKEKTGHGLASEITTKLINDGLNIENCRGQDFDNSANMAGKYNGVQSKICQINELARFVPCSAHSLNLIGFHAANVIHSTITFFGVVQQIIVNFRAGSLLPVPDSNYKFLQIYFMGNSPQEIDLRCAHNNLVKRSIVEQLQTLFHEHHQLIILFKTALDLMPSDNYKIVIRADKTPAGQHARHFNTPTIDEVAIVVVGENLESRDIVLHRRNDRLQRIKETHRSYDALQYPIMFWQGEDGYDFSIKMINPITGN